MKLLLLILIVSCAFFNLAFGGISTIPNAVNKDHPGKCYLGTTNPPVILSPGDTSTLPGKCQRVICDRKLNIEIHTCGVILDKQGCKKQETAGRPYPECCPRIKCS